MSFKYTKSTKVKEFLNSASENIRVSSKAMGKLGQYTDCAVKNAIENSIHNLPTVGQGATEGRFKRLTLRPAEVGDPIKKYKPKFVNMSKVLSKKASALKIKDPLDGRKNIQIRVSDDAKKPLAKKLDQAVNKALDQLIDDVLPRKQRGPSVRDGKGDLRRKTIFKEDFKKFDGGTCRFE